MAAAENINDCRSAMQNGKKNRALKLKAVGQQRLNRGNFFINTHVLPSAVSKAVSQGFGITF
jgi:hypothetical protein